MDRADQKASRTDELSELAGKSSQNPFREFLYLVVRTRKFWMVPIILALLFAGMIVATGGSPLAPLIYALF